MAAEKTDVLLIGPPKAVIVNGLAGPFNLIKLSDAKDPEKLFAEIAPRVRAIAVSGTEQRVNGAFMTRFPKLEIISSFGVGYDHVDAGWAGKHGITVTNTPDVLTEEVADTALGLLLCTVREFPQAERYVRAGKWAQKGYPLSKATLRNRTVGMVGLGRIGQAIARRLEAMQVPGAETKNLINAEVLAALGPNGILINMARGSVVDEAALIKALQDKTILSAGLDVYAREPEVPAELIAMDHVVLFPHLGSASVATREKMDQLVVDNLLAWAAGKSPLTPVAETPWPPKKRS
jgi:lactate dehydrogenase-like 2-hydroxyacid dehydrogenase